MKKIYQRASDLLDDKSDAKERLLATPKIEEHKELLENVKKARLRQKETDDLAASVCNALTDEDLFGPPERFVIPDVETETDIDPDELSRLTSLDPLVVTENDLKRLAAIDPLVAAEVGERASAARAVQRAHDTAPQSLSRYTQLPSPHQVTNEGMIDLFNSLRINLNNRLNKSDTMNLLASLLTCNEAQLDSLLTDRRVPIALKIVIRRLLTDARVGDMEAIERLWDRVFGKTPAMSSMPSASESPLSGILPDTPVSREAYLIIRERIIGKD
jgi:hypothetical protein